MWLREQDASLRGRGGAYGHPVPAARESKRPPAAAREGHRAWEEVARPASWRGAWVLGLLVAGLLVTQVGQGDESLVTWAEGEGEGDGATRDFYNRAAHLAWTNPNGDWRDARGERQGDAAYASVQVRRGASGYVDFDVSRLVGEWLKGSMANHGFLLRCGNGIVDFATREADEAPPLLVIGRRRDQQTLEAVADTQLSPSTYRSLGQRSKARCDASGERMLVRFDLDGVAVAKPAILRLATVGQYANVTQVDVFAAAPGASRLQPELTTGIATAYRHDEGLEWHPQVIKVERFERSDWLADGWSAPGRRDRFRRVSAGESAHGFEPVDGAALEVTIAEGGHYGLNLSYDFLEQLGVRPDEVFLRYYMRFGDDWAPVGTGGKLPGIAGTYIGSAHAGGWGGRTSNGRNGWSARGLFEAVIPAGNPLAGRTPIGTYLYHADQRGTYGDLEVWNESWTAQGQGGLIENGRWFAYEVHVRLNTPGRRDGLVEGWIDGVLAYRREGLVFRAADVDYLDIERVWMNVYFGGSPVSPADQHLYLDNVVVARDYIGPMGR